MTAWHELPEGTEFESAELPVTEQLVDDLVRLGGYVHPLFTDPDYVRTSSPLPARPLPGGAVLHLMGGLAEQCEALDGSVLALLGYDQVRFRAPALAGDSLRLRMRLGPTTPGGRPGREELRLDWSAVRSDGTVVAEAVVRMLVARP